MNNGYEISRLEANFRWEKDRLLPDETFVNYLADRLREEVHQQSKMKSDRRFPAGWKLAGFMTAAIILIVLFIGPAKVYAQIQKWFGYVDNFGMVEQSSGFRVLKEPVRGTKDGVSLFVSEALLSDKNTVIHFEFEGLNNDQMVPMPGDQICSETGIILLPDGRQQRLDEVIPRDIHSVKLTFGCIPSSVLGKTPVDWEVSLDFVDAPEVFKVYPVVTVSNPGTGATDDRAEKQGSGLSTEMAPTQEVVKLEVLQSIPSDTGTILILSIQSQYPKGWHVFTGMPTVTDAEGKQIEFTVPENALNHFNGEAFINANEGMNQQFFAIQVQPAAIEYPLSISLQSKHFRPASADNLQPLTVNLGGNVEKGKLLMLNQPFMIAGEELLLESIQIEDQGYLVKVIPGKTINYLDLEILECESFAAGGTGYSFFTPPWLSYGFVCENSPSTDKLTLVFSNPMIGSELLEWSTTWQP